MKTQIIYFCFLSLFIMFSNTYSQIIPDFQVNENIGGADQSGCSIAADSSGNFVITWGDGRDGEGDVYAQRYLSDGTALGSNFRVNENTGSLVREYMNAPPPSISSDSNGNFVITWTDERNDQGDIYAQRYSSDGTAIGSNFKVNDDEGSAQSAPSIAIDGKGNFVITWEDDRNGDGDFYAQRYSNDGIALGSNFAVNDYTGSAGMKPRISTDGSGNFVITWIDERNDNDNIYAQRYSSDGTALGSNFKVNDGKGTYYFYISISSNKNGDFVITFREDENGEDIYAQRYSSDGTAIGSNFKVNDDEGSEQWAPSIATDGNGNFVITWSDNRNNKEEIFAQRYSNDGTAIGSNFKVCDEEASAHESDPYISSDDSGNFVITWCDYRNGNEWEDGDIYAQRFSNDGTALYGNFKVNDDEESAFDPSISTDDSGNFVITWADLYGEYGWDYYGDIYAQRYSSDGNALGTNFKVNDSTGTARATPSISTDGSGNFVITWTDRRNGDHDIYAQRYSSDGTALGSNFKVNNDAGNSDQLNPSISSDKSGRFVITWRDGRNNNMDIYAQRYSSEGIALDENFVVNDNYNESHTSYYSSIASDSTGNFVITWEDEGNNYDVIYAQRYSSDGTPLGSNFKVNDYEGYIGWLSFISSDVSGNFVITWEDGRNGHPDIYAQRYSSDGTALGSNFKVNESDSIFSQYEISISSNGNGNFVITWTDYNNDDTQIYAQRYSSDGSSIGGNFRVTNKGFKPDVSLWNGLIFTTWTDNRDNEGGPDIWANVLDWDNPVGISDKNNPKIPSAYQLSQNYPNPFNPRTIINYELPIMNDVNLSIYNLLGQKVATLVSERQNDGFQQVEWDASGFASGIYYYRIQAGEFEDVKKMVLIR